MRLSTGRQFGVTSVAIVAISLSLAAQQASRRSNEIPERIAEMQHHFVDVTIVHEAIIRGDLQATLQPAARLSTVTAPVLMPESSSKFLEGIRLAGRRIVAAPTLANATVEVTRMLRQCGSCHQSMSVFPARRTRTGPDLGGIVGHMLEHQRALDDLLLGLVVPSDGRWREGAARLRAAVLHPADWPSDAKLTADIRRAEETVHNIADEAARATTPTEQGAVYSRLLMTCGSCHGLHARIWGPRSQ
jgi:hypothetical protein